MFPVTITRIYAHPTSEPSKAGSKYLLPHQSRLHILHVNVRAHRPHVDETSLTPTGLSRLLLSVHQSRNLNDFWSALIRLLGGAIPSHSVSLYFNYFKIRSGFWALHHQQLPGKLQPWSERRKVSPTPAYLRTHVGQKIFGSEDLMKTTPEETRRAYTQKVMHKEGWAYLLGMGFWNSDQLDAVLAIRRTHCQGPFTRETTVLMQSLHGHLEMALRQVTEKAEAARLAGLESLSPAELDVALAASRGLSNKEIASGLGKSEATVKAQLQAAFSKLEIRRRSQLTLRLFPCGQPIRSIR